MVVLMAANRKLAITNFQKEEKYPIILPRRRYFAFHRFCQKILKLKHVFRDTFDLLFQGVFVGSNVL